MGRASLDKGPRRERMAPREYPGNQAARHPPELLDAEAMTKSKSVTKKDNYTPNAP